MAERGLSASDVVTEIRAQNVQAAAGVIGSSPHPAGRWSMQLSVNAQGRLQSPEEFGDIVVKSTARRRRHPAARRRADRDGRRRLLAAVAAEQQGSAVAVPVFQAPGSNAHPDRRAPCARPWRRSSRTCPTAWTTRSSTTPTQFVRASIERWCTRLLEAVVSGRHRRGAVSADVARLHHPAGGRTGLESSARSGDASVRTSRSTRSACSAWCWPSASWWTTRSSWSRTWSATSRPATRPATRRPTGPCREVSGPIVAIALVL